MTPDGKTVRIQIKDANGNVGWTSLGEKCLKEVLQVTAEVAEEDFTSIRFGDKPHRIIEHEYVYRGRNNKWAPFCMDLEYEPLNST